MADIIPIRPARPALPESLSRDQARDLIGQVLQDSANLIWKEHVYERMEQRGVTDMQVLQVLRRGAVTADPVFGRERNWEVRMEADTGGERIRVGAAIDVNGMGFLVVVITVVVL